MLDIKFLRENPELVKKNLEKRGMDAKPIDRFIILDKKLKQLLKDIETLRHRRNVVSEEINQLIKKGEQDKIPHKIQEAKELPARIAGLEDDAAKIEKEFTEILMSIPNIIDNSVPIGDASHNKVLKKYGEPKKYSFKIKGHEELLKELDLIDLEKAAEVAGARFYYLKGDLVKLNYAIINFTLDFLRKKGFTLIQPPYMLNRKALSGAVSLSAFEEMIYKIQDEDLYLIGTAEHALNAYYSNEVINAKKLPVRLTAYTPCFRKEAGAHGKDTKGIFRVHQFDKIEQFIFCKPEQSWEEFDFILNNSIELYKKLEIPFRTIVLSSQDTGIVATKTVDLEGWFPVQNAYRELGSCSNCLDFQARRSNIKYTEKGERKFAHTLNNTAIATQRMIVCLVENHQQKDGSIKIPEALQKYTGFKLIKKSTGILGSQKSDIFAIKRAEEGKKENED
ncbi:serine--tRNA ligase [Candidatus Pacearchaeota archaeon]|nr:serine--tRNA ligase [Candidatus Pacearchaeota archaeon]